MASPRSPDETELDRARKRVNRALRRLRNDDPEEARHELEWAQTLVEDETSRDTTAMSAEIEIVRGIVAESREEYKTALDHYVSSVDTAEEARQEADHPGRLEERAAIARHRAGRIFEAQSNQRGARSTFQGALKAGARSETPQGLSVAAKAGLKLGHLQAESAGWDGGDDEAAKTWLEAWKAGRDCGRRSGLIAAGNAVLEIALVVIRKQRYEPALQVLEKMDPITAALDGSPRDELAAGASVLRGVTLHKLERFEDSREAFERGRDLGRRAGTDRGYELARRARHHLGEGDEDDEENCPACWSLQWDGERCLSCRFSAEHGFR